MFSLELLVSPKFTNIAGAALPRMREIPHTANRAFTWYDSIK